MNDATTVDDNDQNNGWPAAIHKPTRHSDECVQSARRQLSEKIRSLCVQISCGNCMQTERNHTYDLESLGDRSLRDATTVNTFVCASVHVFDTQTRRRRRRTAFGHAFIHETRRRTCRQCWTSNGDEHGRKNIRKNEAYTGEYCAQT